MTRYELIERIGVGAVAEIFRGKAIAAGGFEKPVAIKRILPHLGEDRRFVEALMAEAKILSQLRHRNIVQIFDVGLGDDGQYFLVMEFVDGLDLAEIQRTLEGRRKRLPLDLALHLGAEICEALEHAHTALAPDGRPMRLVHRDVGPSNVLVSRHGEVKLTDFGLARRPEEVTQGTARNKFGYLSPEASAGLPIDVRSDVFSAAVIVYELTLGRRLFSHLTDLEAMRAVAECKVPRPRDVDPSLPPALDEILMSALVRDPARRIGSASGLGGQLRSLRYSLDSAAGDPAVELARVVIGVEAAGDTPGDDVPSDARKASGQGKRRRAASSAGSFPGEPTFVSLTSIDAFKDDRDGTGLIKARAVLDRFEEEETRLASQPGLPGGGGRWREQQDTLDAVVAGLPLGGGVRETAPTGIFVGPEGARPAGTGEITSAGRPRPLTDDADESTKVLSPAQIARRVAQTPPRLPGLAKHKSPPPSPPPTPPPKERALKIEARVPARTATPTVSEHPGGRTAPSSPSAPAVAGFDRGAPRTMGRRWLVILAVVVLILAAGVTAALLR